MIVVGITGTLGAGKGTIVDYLIENKQFLHFSVRDFLITEIKKRKLEINRDSMTSVANELRAQRGPDYIIKRLYRKAKAKGTNCVIESIRNLSEIAALRKKGDFVLLAVDAAAEIRYARIQQRKSETDNTSYETFLANEAREMHTNDPNHQNLAACIREADFKLSNDGSIEDLHHQIEHIISQILIHHE